VLSGLAATGQVPAGVAELLAAGSQWWRACRSGEDYPAAHARFEAALRSAAAVREGALRGRGVGTEQVAAYPAPSLIALELAYHRARPFTWAWLACLAGALALGWGARAAAPARWRRLGLALSLAGLACIGLGLGARVAITGLGAVSNLYETLVWVALMGGVLGLGLWRATGRIGFAVAGMVSATLCALVGEAIPPEYGAALGQLQPVLRSRFWLWLHVKVVVAAYAPFLLAWALGNWALWRAWRSGGRVAAGEAQALYRCLQVGTVLMAAGTLLGGVWADQAWGRFWGWDPKEVGALIVVLVYLVPLHLRYVGWAGPEAMAGWSVLGFLAVVWSWYGVNFIQATGLHAYTFGSSSRLDQLLVGVAVVIQVAVTTALLVALRRRRASSPDAG
jgi:ABC-type transport system involved in cytochrome c biogenesis permease subunit